VPGGSIKTGLTNNYDFKIRWKQNKGPDGHSANIATLNQALQDQVGLELVETNAPVEMLVIEKPN
jgi:uncharacterized protein (TIGR03435 family)